MGRYLYLTTLFVFNIITSDEAARILGVFPTPSISHQVVFRPLVKELVSRGHELIVITTDPMYSKEESPKNLTEIDVHDISYSEWAKILPIIAENKDNPTNITGFEMITDIFEKQIQTDEVQRLIHNKDLKFDLILAESWVKITLVFAHWYKAPVIQISSLGPGLEEFDAVGAPSHPLLYPSYFSRRLYNLTMWEKITALSYYCLLRYIFYRHEEYEHEMLKRNFGADVPSFNELRNNVHMLFLNTHPIWEGNTPMPPSVIYMGGAHQIPEKPLPKDLKDYLDSSLNGIIYMSFGTNAKTSWLPPEIIQLFVRVFSRLPYNVLWKWDEDVLPGQTENIRIGKWFPQADLLRHPNIKLFITQGGLQSTDEAITAGVPLLGIPMIGDQWYNAEKYVYHKIGLKLDLESLTEEDFEKAINNIIGDKSFRDNIARLCALMRDQPTTPLERAAWWTEHALRHSGAGHLRAPAANMRWTHYYEIELVLTLIGSLVLLLSMCVFIVCQFWSCVKRNLNVKTKIKVN